MAHQHRPKAALLSQQSRVGTLDHSNMDRWRLSVAPWAACGAVVACRFPRLSVAGGSLVVSRSHSVFEHRQHDPGSWPQKGKTKV